MLRFFKKLIVILLLLGVVATAVAGITLYWMVAVDPGPEIELDYIESILGRESHVFYNDGSSKIGVLFQDAHRQYLPYHQVPKQFVNAIVAAEDDAFFQHHGVDILGIARAMVANVKARRIVQGGSTITQQTAKNIFKRESRKLKDKFKELLQALRLEYHYPKEKILEFYLNQFFVSGNGHGLGVAARYYFDKDVKELTLLENAFIAGSVKRPNYYNPFTKSSEDKSNLARKRAAERASYVLRRMLELGNITDKEYKEAKASSLEFRRGKMSFALNTVMDLVRDGLSSPQIVDALEDNGISNVSTSGIRIITTIDKDLQQNLLHDLRRELSRLDVRMRGYARDDVQDEYSALDYSGDIEITPGAFLFGIIDSIDSDQIGNPLIRVSFNNNKTEGVLDIKGLGRIVDAYARFNGQRWSEADNENQVELLGQLKKGDTVYVSVREMSLSGTPVLDLERFPDVQGAGLILQQGSVLAMAGGMENRYFNRAVNARRLMGSTFKPFLFSAALQLGWNTVDMLGNRRNIFVFQNKPYFPRPDHISPHERVSMSWAGVNSENLAAIWLLYHLTDQLTPPRLREIAGYLDLAPRTKNGNVESRERFKQRIRDKYGIVVNHEILEQAAYDKTVKMLEADFLFDNRVAEYRQLKKLPYGLHFDQYADEIAQKLEDAEDLVGVEDIEDIEDIGEENSEKELSESEKKEMKLRLDILGRNYLAMEDTMSALQQYRDFLAKEEGVSGIFNAFPFLDNKSEVQLPEGVFYKNYQNDKVMFSLVLEKEGWIPMSFKEVKSLVGKLDDSERELFWERVQLEGYLSVYAFRQVSSQLEKEKQSLFAARPYSMEVLAEVRDYRVMVGLQYLIHLGHEAGIESDLEPVLSFPLGANVITLLDAVRLYEAMVTGKRYFVEQPEGLRDDTVAYGVAVIDRIETVDGEEIYARKVQAKNIYEPEVSSAIGHILQNTVKYGTGRYAYRNVRLKSTDPQKYEMLEKMNLPLPLFGKTGTANQFRNAAFLGYVPGLYPGKTDMRVQDGYTVGVYVGFDDNREMVRTSTHITGASGALPAWTAIVQDVVNKEIPDDRIDIADLSFNGLALRYPDTRQVFVPVDKNEGGGIITGRQIIQSARVPDIPSVLTYGMLTENGRFEPERLFQPYWITGQEPTAQ